MRAEFNGKNRIITARVVSTSRRQGSLSRLHAVAFRKRVGATCCNAWATRCNDAVAFRPSHSAFYAVLRSTVRHAACAEAEQQGSERGQTRFACGSLSVFAWQWRCSCELHAARPRRCCTAYVACECRVPSKRRTPSAGCRCSHRCCSAMRCVAFV